MDIRLSLGLLRKPRYRSQIANRYLLIQIPVGHTSVPVGHTEKEERI